MSGGEIEAVVAGGGLVGMAASIVLARAGLRTLHLAPPAPPDRRTSALMMPAVRLLESAGLVEDPAGIGNPLTAIRIIDATGRLVRAPEVLFEAAEQGFPAFGWNFPNTALAERFAAIAGTLPGLTRLPTLLSGIAREGEAHVLTLSDGTVLRAPLLVGADGRKSLVRAASGIGTRETVHDEAALVCDLELSRPLEGVSVEFHYPKGPFTLVPAGGNRANLVWIDAAGRLAEARVLSPEALGRLLGEKAQNLFGAISPTGPAHVFPLGSLSVETAGRDGVVLVGEAAHAFPPIGAQGLNLGLRDVADLSEAVAGADKARPDWARRASEDYAGRRRADLARTGGVVGLLFGSLISDLVPAQMLRAGGLWGLRASRALRARAFALGMGERS